MFPIVGLFQGEMYNKVKVDDSFWTLEDGKDVSIALQKVWVPEVNHNQASDDEASPRSPENIREIGRTLQRSSSDTFGSSNATSKGLLLRS